jgi:alkylation response protein AidB-like acyl-CoA dehydrogenase
MASVPSAWVPSTEQIALADMLRDLLRNRSGEADVRRAMDSHDGHDEGLWRALAALGVCGLAVPEVFGGAGASLVEVSIACEELGRALSCVPYLSSVVLAQSVLLNSPDLTVQQRWLPPLASGEVIGTVALNEPQRSWHGRDSQTAATNTNGQWLLTGTKTFVPDGHAAGLVLVVARASAELGVWAVDGDARGLTRTQLPVMDQTRRLTQLVFDATPATLVTAPGEADLTLTHLLDVAAITIASECAGGAGVALEMAVDYAKTRVQFGRPIGSFQAIKHRCADMLIQAESAQSAVSYARHVLAVGTPEQLSIAAAMAKSFCADAYVYCSGENIQVHGGIGFTWEHSAHLYYKRARTNQVLFGDPVQHRARLGDLLGV